MCLLLVFISYSLSYLLQVCTLVVLRAFNVREVKDYIFFFIFGVDDFLCYIYVHMCILCRVHLTLKYSNDFTAIYLLQHIHTHIYNTDNLPFITEVFIDLFMCMYLFIK